MGKRGVEAYLQLEVPDPGIHGTGLGDDQFTVIRPTLSFATALMGTRAARTPFFT